ncbi:MAG TPA: Gfo/Idh/MocA family oxidoreductase [Gaiellaceae bacterium]|nr:Gfo/Idh/MocA family oxidoreductase [Gaiellaceae bacterium]
MPPPVRIALAGLGDIGVRAHLPAILREPGAELAALVEPDPGKRAAAARLAPGVPAAAELGEVLDAVDAVVLATPAWVTPQLAREALAAGVHVLAEKPLAPTLAEQLAFRDVPGAAERLQIGLTYRHHPAIARLREIVSAGALGHPLYVQSSLADERADPDGEPEHYARRLRTLEHGLPVVFDGIHRCDQLNLVLGEAPVDVTGWALRTRPEYASPNVNGALLGYADGTLVRLEVIWLVPSLPPSQFVVTGPRGRVAIDPPTFALTAEIDGRTEELRAPGDKTEVCFALQLEGFVAACVEGRPPTPGLEDALAASALCERIAQACLAEQRRERAAEDRGADVAR